jgi:predicted nucleic acid-binding protein
VRLVVDASVVVPCFVPERFSQAARGWVVAADVLLAPELLSLECANALWKKVRLGELTLHDARSAVERIVSGFVELRSSTSLASTALELGTELNHPVYDCVYIALAEAERAAFLTADRKLVDLVTTNRPTLRAYWIAQEIPKVLH